jgi:hypothetical protein
MMKATSVGFLESIVAGLLSMGKEAEFGHFTTVMI